MSPLEQRIAVAEFCGWEKCSCGDEQCGAWFPLNSIKAELGPPDYLTDLNAMHEAEKLLDYDLAVVYCGLISMLTGQLKPFKPAGIQGAICHATAAQRAEALLRSIGKWKA